MSPNSLLDTFPKLLVDRARRHPAKIAMHEKDLGIWQAWSWSRILAEVRALACGLAARGCIRGDKERLLATIVHSSTGL